MTNYSKLFAAVVVTVLSAVSAALFGDNTISSPEWVNIAIAGVGACAVFAAPNVPFAKYTKSVLAALTAALTILASAISGGVHTTEWIQIVIAALGAVGVYAVRNGDTIASPNKV